MKLNPTGLSGDQEQLSEDQLHAEGSFASLDFSKDPIVVLKSSLSTAALLQVPALPSKTVASRTEGEAAGAAKAPATRERTIDSFMVKRLVGQLQYSGKIRNMVCKGKAGNSEDFSGQLLVFELIYNKSNCLFRWLSARGRRVGVSLS